MKTIILKPSHFAGQPVCATFPSWISNGHWMIRRNWIANAPMFRDEETIRVAFPALSARRGVRLSDNDDGVQRMIPSGKYLSWVVTHWTVLAEFSRRGKPRRHYMIAQHGNETNGQFAAFDADYFALLGIEPGDIIYGTANNRAFIDMDDPKDASWVLMPFSPDTIPAPLPAPKVKS